VLLDLINALACGMESIGQVKYTVLLEDDLQLDPGIAAIVDNSRSEARRLYNI
jgi:hypothetical protein